MTYHPSTAAAVRSCILALSTSAEDLKTFVPAFFEREYSHLDDESRQGVLILTYEYCWSRAEDLQRDARRILDASEGSEAPELVLQALGPFELSRDYFEIFKRLGSYLIEKKREARGLSQ